MRAAITFMVLIAASSTSFATHRARVSRAEFAQALKRADPAFLGKADRSLISMRSVRVVRCIAPDEEPTEFQCDWQLRTKRGWQPHRNWMTVDANGWRVMDQ